jgi:hypothetical protein
MVLGKVGPYDENALRAGDVRDGVGHAHCTQGPVKAYDRWGVAEPGAVVYVSTAEDPGKLLHQVVLFVGALG